MIRTTEWETAKGDALRMFKQWCIDNDVDDRAIMVMNRSMSNETPTDQIADEAQAAIDSFAATWRDTHAHLEGRPVRPAPPEDSIVDVDVSNVQDA